MTGNLTSSEVKSLGSQVFIELLANGNGGGKGISASIKFGKIMNQFLQSIVISYKLGTLYMHPVFGIE